MKKVYLFEKYLLATVHTSLTPVKLATFTTLPYQSVYLEVKSQMDNTRTPNPPYHPSPQQNMMSVQLGRTRDKVSGSEDHGRNPTYGWGRRF